jgi:hypothetical protein
LSSTLSSNSTAGVNAFGGGVRAFDHVTLTNSTVSGNMTTGDFAYGGGVFAYGDVTLTSSTVSGNSTAGERARGGGVHSHVGNVTLISSTVSGNSTRGSEADGGGVTCRFGGVTLTHSTVMDNHAYHETATGAGIYSGSADDPIVISGTIVTGNTAGSGNPDLSPTSGAVTAAYSLIGNANGLLLSGTNILIGVDPLLGPLTDNGGPTETHALLAGSPAIDTGDPSAEAGVGEVPLYDQRGFAFSRVVGGRIDMGAIEADAVSADFDIDGDDDGGDFLAWQRGYGLIAPNATNADGDADVDQDVDGDDLAVWRSQFGTGVVMVATSSAVPTATAPTTAPSVAPQSSHPIELMNAALAMAIAEQQALPEEDAVFVDDRLSLETPYEAVFALNAPMPPAGVSFFDTSSTPLSSEADEQEESEYLDEAVDKVFESLFG